ncbi:hypothetical protein IP90_03049 [Luteimonas cucumeris]|uniref:Uncharacterized protein n=1 Tax=Luteimonas cucumeris TaxID=985012 RepID=A0A562KWG1_9GAMM|nr:hypothetical protein [Luteimonas cucumeris]TWH99741.1 hypothetical protein IP90_03049 [Luteimonas cucumeris]
MLVLTLSSASLILGLHWGHAGSMGDGSVAPTYAAMRGLGWLRSFGRLSYEIYLSHMFVVFGIVALFRSAGGDLRSGFWWYLPVLLLCWLLGAAIARGFSEPCDRALRRRWLPGRGETGAFELQRLPGDSPAS